VKYDFEKRVDRSGENTSSKWMGMYRKKKNVSAGVIPLSVADMELYNPPEITEGLKKYLDEAVLGYTRPGARFTGAVLRWMKDRHSWEVKPEWLVQSPGVVPALFLAVRAVTEAGDGVIIQPPVYYPFSMAIQAGGRRLVSNPLKIEGGRYVMDYEDLQAKARDGRNRALILSSPHNPVGRVWTREELARTAEICAQSGVTVISDEIHFDLLLPGHTHTVFAALSKTAGENAIICTAPSKTFNIAGMQISNIIIPNEKIRERFRKELMDSAIHEPNILGLKACEIAYTECGPWLDAFLGHLAANHRITRDFFAEHLPMVTVFPLEGTYLQWLDFRALGLEPKALEEFMVNEAEWFVDEGYIFGEGGAGFERVNLACPASVLSEAFDRLLRAARKRGWAGR
jgi:putative C-S lyase